MKIGILGAGKVGVVLAQLALKAGHEVYIAGSGDQAKIALSVKILAPGAHAVTKEEVAREGDIVILAIPLSKYASIPKASLGGKLVIDAMNHWYEVDGPREDTVPNTTTSSEFIQSFLNNARVVKALSHMGYHELHDTPLPKGATGRKAIALAGDVATDTDLIAQFIDTLGFDPLIIGKLATGRVLEPGSIGFGANKNREELKKLLT